MKLRAFEKIMGIAIIALFILNMSNLVTVFGLVSLLAFMYAMLYFLFGLGIVNNKKINEAFKVEPGMAIETTLSIGMGLSICSIILGFLFVHMNFPNVNINGFFGIMVGIIILTITLISKNRINLQASQVIKKRLTLYLLIGFSIVLLPKHAFLKIRHRNNPEFIEAVIKAHSNPNDTILWRKVEVLKNEMKK